MSAVFSCHPEEITHSCFCRPFKKLFFFFFLKTDVWSWTQIKLSQRGSSGRSCCQVNWLVIWQWSNQTAWGRKSDLLLLLFFFIIPGRTCASPSIGFSLTMSFSFPLFFICRHSLLCGSFHSFLFVCVFFPPLSSLLSLYFLSWSLSLSMFPALLLFASLFLNQFSPSVSILIVSLLIYSFFPPST